MFSQATAVQAGVSMAINPPIVSATPASVPNMLVSMTTGPVAGGAVAFAAGPPFTAEKPKALPPNPFLVFI